MSVPECCEELVFVVLTGLVVPVVVAAAINLCLRAVLLMIFDLFDPVEHNVFQTVLGMIFTAPTRPKLQSLDPKRAAPPGEWHPVAHRHPDRAAGARPQVHHPRRWQDRAIAHQRAAGSVLALGAGHTPSCRLCSPPRAQRNRAEGPTLCARYDRAGSEMPSTRTSTAESTAGRVRPARSRAVSVTEVKLRLGRLETLCLDRMIVDPNASGSG